MEANRREHGWSEDNPEAIERTMAPLQTCTVRGLSRTLLHWAAFHNVLELLRWLTIRSSAHPEFTAFINAQDKYGYTALHLGALANRELIVDILLAYSETDTNIAAGNMRACEENESKSNGLTSLHIAARNGSLNIVIMLMKSTSANLSAKSTSGKTALHYAAEGGNWRVMGHLLEVLKERGKVEIANECDTLRQTPLYLAASKQNVDAVEILLREGEGLRVDIVTWEGITALDIAKKNDHGRLKKMANGWIVDMLESFDINWLQAERQKYANAANCLLVGAALTASVAYAGWLQPPLGLAQYYELPNRAAPPGSASFQSYVGVEQHSEIHTFWFFNSISFFCSVATFIVGADAGIPDKCVSLREEVVQLRNSVVRASFILSVAILFVIGAFASAGILVLPPVPRHRAPMAATVAVGVGLCLVLLMKFVKKLWIWFRSPKYFCRKFQCQKMYLNKCQKLCLKYCH